jgi:hypothetical protein
LVQSLAQLPQCVLLDATSQPSSVPETGKEQLAWPSAQLDTHNPPAHCLERTPSVAQARPHAPQLPTSLESKDSQPLLAIVSQSS